MRRLVDVVNFNSDASCLSSRRWLDILHGGKESTLARWLQLYVRHRKKVIIGFTGATIADMSNHNPEALDLINRHPDIFEIILRPFAHDIALTRIGKGFSINFDCGRKTTYREFRNIRDYFLPPEFMLTNKQIAELKGKNVRGIFINPSRFSTETCNRIPLMPYKVMGLFDSSIDCIPFHGRLTESYLEALHKFDDKGWNGNIVASHGEVLFAWRDGESSFLMPDGLARESCWLENEEQSVKRHHLMDLEITFIPNEALEDHQYRSYPVHSFSAWMKEFRMLGFINRVHQIEESLETMTEEQIGMWMLVINSDILSAIEKKSPVVKLTDTPESQTPYEYRILRSERGFEGEEYLAILDMLLKNDTLPDYLLVSAAPHIIKMRTRLEYLKKIPMGND